jgi:hexosaminidase
MIETLSASEPPAYTADRHTPTLSDLIPTPARVEAHGGRFALTAKTWIASGAATFREALLLAQRIRHGTGLRLPVTNQPDAVGTSVIVLQLETSLAHLGDEGYRLVILPDRVIISAPASAGVFYGIQTLLQFLPAEVYSTGSATERSGRECSLPCGLIEDTPRFRWRGAMLDVARNYLAPSFIRKFIDGLAAHKMNTLHLHLTDDQGWRLEIPRYPRLTTVGAARRRTQSGQCTKDPADPDFDPAIYDYDETPHGGYYTQEQMRQIVAYAADRHIRIVPEIDMPGHAQAAIAAYPELGCTPEPLEVSSCWGIHANIYNPAETTIRFLQNVLDDVLAVFPSPYIHIGGDEVVKRQWERNAAARQVMRNHGLRDEKELQSWFVGRMGTYLSERGRRLIGWDEILEGGLVENAIVMSWRGEEGGITAARLGHEVIMAPSQRTYFDHYQSPDHAAEPLAFPGTVSLEDVYSYDPLPEGMPSAEAHLILGAQGQLWSEYLTTERQVEYMAYPRISALSEVVWSQLANKDYPGFCDRLQIHRQRLNHMGFTVHP